MPLLGSQMTFLLICHIFFSLPLISVQHLKLVTSLSFLKNFPSLIASHHVILSWSSFYHSDCPFFITFTSSVSMFHVLWGTVLDLLYFSTVCFSGEPIHFCGATFQTWVSNLTSPEFCRLVFPPDDYRMSQPDFPIDLSSWLYHSGLLSFVSPALFNGTIFYLVIHATSHQIIV